MKRSRFFKLLIGAPIAAVMIKGKATEIPYKVTNHLNGYVGEGSIIRWTGPEAGYYRVYDYRGNFLYTKYFDDINKKYKIVT